MNIVLTNKNKRGVFYIYICCLLGFLFADTLVLADEQKASDSVTEQTEQTGDEGDAGAKEDEKSDADRYRILPIPVFVTEPAIGKGLGVAVALFHPLKDGSSKVPSAGTPASIASVDDGNDAPPIVTGVFGAYTSSKTWVAGAGHSNHWRDDSIRYVGAGAVAEINSEFYILDVPFAYSMKGFMIYQDLKFRLKRSDWFLGSSLSVMSADSVFELDFPVEALGDPFAVDLKNIGLAVRASYDSRNNTSYPETGQLIDLSVWRYDETIGGDFNYWSAKLKALSFHSFGEKFTLGARFEVTAIDGKAPFFGVPWVTLRGIAAMRYQNKVAGEIELEGRYRLAPRWEVLAFAGMGFTSDHIPYYQNPDSIYNFGTGARFNIFEAQNIWIGIDIARGPEDWNWYVQVGQSW